MNRASSGQEGTRDAAAEICVRIGASLERFLGSGAQKDAYLISLKGEFLALKIAALATPGGRFEREVAALQNCSHPSIARLAFICTERVAGSDYWVIGEEFLEGGTLQERLAAAPLPREEIRRIALSLASALTHLQERGLVHRDIKPANILFRRQDEPVLTDFGIVRVLGEPSLTHDFIPQGPGTPLYASPEQLNNEKALIDWRTDQFGLALVLAECLLGRPAFASNGRSLRDAVFAVANRTPLPVESKAELESAGFGMLVRALSPWPVQRFRLPSDFVDALAKD